MLITISGSPGSGKSTLAKELTQKLGYKFHSVGDLRRAIAKKRGLTLAEYNHWSETHKSGDIFVDRAVRRLGEKNDNLIVEGRLAWHFIPQSMKIFLYLDTAEGAKRIWSSYAQDQDKRNEDSIASLADLKESLEKRVASDRLRYKKYYNLDIFDKKHYDLWLDVGPFNKKQEFDAVWGEIKNRLTPPK